MGKERNPLVAVAVAPIFVCLSLRAGVGAPRAAQAPVVTVGVLAFQDESGTAVEPALAGQLARTLRQKLAAADESAPAADEGASAESDPEAAVAVEADEALQLPGSANGLLQQSR